VSAPSTAIIAALPEELGPLQARLVGTCKLRMPGGTAVAGRLAGHDVVVMATGDGARLARAGLELLLAHVAVERLVLIGIAGALTPDLALETLVVASEVRQGAEVFVAEPAAVERLVRHCGARPVTLVTTDRIADSPAARDRLLRAHGDPVPAAVDLESAVWIGIAREREIPWVALRAISDTADEHLPALLNRAREEGGATRRGQVLRGLMFEPTVIPALVSLRRRVARCAHVLAAGTERLLDADARGSSAA
jgi:adenosylhomocysteine nucleosidase